MQAYGYTGWALGKHRQSAKTEIEKLKLSDLSVDELVKEAASIIYKVRDETKDKNWKLELSWVNHFSPPIANHFIPPTTARLTGRGTLLGEGRLDGACSVL